MAGTLELGIEGSKSITGARHLHTRCNYRRSVAPFPAVFFFSKSNPLFGLPDVEFALDAFRERVYRPERRPRGIDL